MIINRLVDNVQNVESRLAVGTCITVIPFEQFVICWVHIMVYNYVLVCNLKMPVVCTLWS